MNVQRSKGKGRGQNGRRNGNGKGNAIVRAPNPIPKGLPTNHHFNAFGNPTPQALAFSVGPATHLNGLRNFTETISPGSLNKTLMMFQFGGGTKQATRWTSADGGVTWTGHTEYNIDTTGITTSPGPGSPINLMVSRGSVRLRCYTKLLDVQGIVRVLRHSGRLLYTGSSANSEKTNIMNLVKGHQRTRTYGAKELLDCHQWDAIPIDQQSYHSFKFPSSGEDKSNSEPGLTTLIFLFEEVSVSQNYEFSMATSAYGRYDEIGPLAAMAKLPPSAPLNVLNSIRDVAERAGSAGMAVGKAIEGVGYGLSRAYQFARAVGTATRPLALAV